MSMPAGPQTSSGSQPHLSSLATPSQTAGPFVSLGTGWAAGGEMAAEDDASAIIVTGAVLDGAGLPVTDAMLEFWQADSEGRFPPASSPNWTGFARAVTDSDGGYRLRTVKPGPFPDGDGRLQAPHVDVSIFARGLLQRLVTRIYFSDEEANQADPLLLGLARAGLRERLVARLVEDCAALPEYRLDIHLQGDRETVFFGPW